MITNKGKSIISKYLVGQAPSYASYIALGCGAKPLLKTDSFDTDTYLEKKSLDFEMFRVPVISRGYVVEDGVSKIVLTAQIPSENRYEFSEIGLYPAASNPVAQNIDSKILYSFSQNEQWQYHRSAGTKALVPFYSDKLNSSGSDIDVTTTKLAVIAGATVSTENNHLVTYTATNRLSVGDYVDITGVTPSSLNFSNVLVTAVPDSRTTFTVDVGASASGTYTSGGSVQLVSSLSTDDKAFQANSNNLTFSESLRKSRLEIPRFQNSSVIVRGDLSKLSYSSGSLVIADTSSHLHVDTTIDLSRNSILDEVKIAFSVISKNVTQPDPYKVILVAEFGSDDPITGSTIYARLQADLVDGQNGVDFATNRYFVNSVPIRDLSTSSNGFSWSAVKYVRIFASVYATSSDFTSGTVSDDYYIALDGIRLDNISSTSAVYGLTGYTVIKNNYSISGTSTPTTATKESDESHIIEFRFVADVI